MSDKKLPKAWESWKKIDAKDPKALAKLVEAGIELRNERKAHEATAKALETQEKALINHLIETFDKADLTEVKTRLGTGKLVSKEIPQMDESTGGWEAVYAYIVQEAIADKMALGKAKEIAKHVAQYGNWEMLHKRLGERACQERWEAKEKIPGVKKFDQVTIKLGDAE